MIGLIKGTARQLKTVSGLPLPIASYKSNSKLPIQELSLSINYTQSGSGDPAPDNIRPITGVSSVNVTRTGKNLYNKNGTNKLKAYFAGTTIIYNNNSATVYIPCNPNTTYTISKKAATRFRIGYTTMLPAIGVDVYGFIEDPTASSITITTGSDAKFLVAFVFNSTNDKPTTESEMLATVQIEQGATASDYSEYVGNTYNIPFGQTVYGGMLNVSTGLLTIDRFGVDLGTLTFANGDGGANRFVAKLPTAPMTPSVATQQAEIISDIYKTVTSKTIYDGTGNYQIAIHTTGSIWIRNTDYSEATAFKTAMSGHYIVYELATPIEIDLTPTQINSLLGSNNIWHDGNGDVEVLKFMDRQLYFGR